MISGIEFIQHRHYKSNKSEEVRTEIIVETPVSLTVNGEEWLTFLCTPVDLEEMAVGFLYNEEIIESISEVKLVQLCPAGDNIDIWLNHSVIKPINWRRTSGCTGGFTSVNSKIPVKPSSNGIVLSAKAIGELITQLFESQKLYRSAGGVHTSGLSDGCQIVISCEDIGRHNSLDKIAGKLLIDRIYLDNKILITTGRISSEMLQKSARIGASIVISRTSPSSLSISMAQNLGITLIGYARRNSFDIYTHAERIE